LTRSFTRRARHSLSASVKATSTVSSRFCPIAPGAEGSAEPYTYDASEKTAGPRLCEAHFSGFSAKTPWNTPDNTLCSTPHFPGRSTRARASKSRDDASR
jgi:hypothetical protein